MKLRSNNKRRNTMGSGMVEGVTGMILVTSVVVGGVMLLVNSGMATYYKLKIGYVASEAAKYANTHTGQGRINGTKEYAEKLLKILSVNYSGCHIELNDTNLNGVPATVCTVECRDLKLFGNQFGPIEIRDVGVACKNELIVNKTVAIDRGDKTYNIPVFEEKGTETLGDLGTKGYLAASTVNNGTQPRKLNWVLPLEYRKDADTAYDDLQTPRDNSSLRQKNDDFPGYNGITYMEIRSAAVISNNL